MSQYQFAPLLSDYLVYAMLLAAIGLGVAARRSPANRAALRQIASRDVPAAAGVVLAAFLIVGLLDSIHLREPLANTPSDETPRYHMEVRSLLDLLLRDLRTRTETSYSAPFALHGFSKEMTFDENGEALWHYPRLTHAGDGIDDPAQHTGDILRRVLTATAAGSLLCALVVCLGCTLLARRWRLPFTTALRRITTGAAPIAWRAILLTTCVLLLAVCNIAVLATQYHVLGTDKVGQDEIGRAHV